MRELSKSISVDERLHSLIHLRIVYVNLDKSLEKFFSRRVRYPTCTFFWHSTPLKYKGKFRLQNILTAINRAIGLSSWDFPLKKLETATEFESFRESTDRAVILFDLCNYTDKIQKSKHHEVVKPVIVSAGSRGNSNIGMTEDTFLKISNTNIAHETLEDLQDLVSSAEDYQSVFPLQQNDLQEYAEDSSGLPREADAFHGMLVEDITRDKNEFPSNDISRNLVGKNNDGQQKVVSCNDEVEVLSMNSPRFLFAKKSSEEDRHEKSWFTDRTKSGVLTQVEGCNSTEYSRFANVYQRLIKIVRAYTLTPELANFAVVKNKRLLSTWGIEKMQNHTWFLVQWVSDWPNLPRLYYESETLESFFFGSKQLVRELNRESINHPSTFCNSTLPVILFIDKVAPLLEVRTKSWEALTAFRAFAREHVRQENLEVQVSTDLQMESKPASKDLPSLVKSVMPKESVTSLKSSFGQNVVLLPSDQPIRVSKITPSRDHSVLSQETGFGQNVVLKVLVEGNGKVHVDENVLKGELQELDFSKLLLSEDNAIYRIQEGKIAGKADSDSVSSSLESFASLLSSDVDGSIIDLKAAHLGESGKEGLPTVELREEQFIKESNHGILFSFYYADGEDQWKDTVQPALPYPSLVILDSLKGGKFVFPTVNQSIDHISLKAFFDQFAAKKLQKTYVSEISPRKSRKQVQPPFVNRDFHEVDGVPWVTAERLLQLLAHRLSVGHLSVSVSDCNDDMRQFWKRAALVLFTTQSCGFCKRMELIFREVHRLLTCNWDRSTKEGFSLQSMNHPYSTFDNDDQNVDLLGENLLGIKELETKRKLPCLLQIDCTLNDCSVFFASIDQEELYPSVVLYPAQNKSRSVVYGGRPTVQEILKFIAVEGDAGTRILSVLRGSTLKKRSDATPYSQMRGCQSSQSIVIDSSSSSGSRHAYHFPKDTTEFPSNLSQEGGDKGLKPIIYPTVGSVLMATDQLSKASKTFESTKILVVKADGQEGFQGLILNKPLAWNRLPGLAKEMEPLVNKTVLCYGGPVILQEDPFLSLSRLKDMEGFAEVLPSVYVGGASATMSVFQAIREGRLDAANFWFFLGHAVWGWQQLLNEIEQQWWNLTSYGGHVQLPVQEWLEGSTISVADLLRRTI